MAEFNIALDNGKYLFKFDPDTWKASRYRHGEFVEDIFDKGILNLLNAHVELKMRQDLLSEKEFEELAIEYGKENWLVDKLLKEIKGGLKKWPHHLIKDLYKRVGIKEKVSFYVKEELKAPPQNSVQANIMVAEWHEGKRPGATLHEAMGLSWEDYSYWVEKGRLPGVTYNEGPDGGR